MSSMATDYAILLKDIAPKVIKTQEERDRYFQKILQPNLCTRRGRNCRACAEMFEVLVTECWLDP